MSQTRVEISLLPKRSYVGCARNVTNSLGLKSTIGRARPELRPDIRSFPYRGYVIFFRYLNGRFEVVNILEGHRDVEAHFHSDSE